ncbi:ABC transporter substrate-binding protein [Microbacterium trichothecenolyticum]|uniref:NitT/TauT family transport system substrate-binding protein n=1 Tax=Microbacterium trichothecenolyticum TaxID=69370 RepID=A0ABU0TSI0_MICTR|nr:ABC transporter substrate-binding protein [Microbacterium trichothecenolyticum]MDQ1122628.1 NitT/TauT family transport system substrate-binding protein [Microbacterium trichothecenolyticum]
MTDQANSGDHDDDTTASTAPTEDVRPPTTSSPTVLPSGAVLESPADAASPATAGVSRRTLLTGAAVGAAVVAAGGFGGWWFLQSRNAPRTTANGLQVTTSWADRELALTSPSGACEAPLIIAYEKGFFADAGLNVVLKKTGDGEDTTAAVGSGKYIASNGIFFNYLGPIYNGTPVKLSGGLHYGCLDLYTLTDGPVRKVADLRGRKIGVSNLQGSATNFFSLDLLDAGINSSPAAGEVEWVVIEQDLLPKALQDGRVDAIATAGGYLPIIRGVEEGWATVLSDNQSRSANANQPCCAVVLNNTFVSEDPVTAAALVTAWANGARWAGANLEETAEIESAGKYVAGTPEEILPVLKTLTFDPSPKNLRHVLAPGIEKYKKTGFLDADVDVEALADRAFVDLGLNF